MYLQAWNEMFSIFPHINNKKNINYEYDTIDVYIYVFTLAVCGNILLLFRFFSY